MAEKKHATIPTKAIKALRDLAALKEEWKRQRIAVAKLIFKK